MVGRIGLRRVPMTPERAKAIGESYRYLYVLAQMMALEYAEFKDTDFKDLDTHNEIDLMKKGIDFILKKHGAVLGNTDDEQVLTIASELSTIIKRAINVDTKKS